ncbi:ATP-binding cassette domain-containing protein [Nakamurella sp. YIM 132087]|uniref:ATP-binding cassette domain-containing protein n=1 Tax=Nakamurella alba TaxID=2665158 RepID=A0A7K1FHD9_9ACTN|nr:ABC-F family ATP-binding cassette domain-containing protein [Nakamurella alba]MTD12703.1 ATP-binding cassette domain-containing protein [Nakamurella alba]
MANLVNLEAVSVNRGVRTVLDGISLGVQTGDRIGVLGLNGSGKTTLLSVLAGLVPPDSGRVAVSRGTTMEVVTQGGELPPGDTVREVVLARFGDGDHGWASDSAVRGILDGLGLSAIGLDSPVDRLSGGERRRVALAAVLVTPDSPTDILVLDEPTNHLDIEGVAWLAEHLLSRRSALITVTHDRWFLDAVATTTWEVVDGTVYIREGGYSDWVFARAERLRLDRAAEDRRKNLARKELAWLRRGAPARTSKPRYRIDAAEALIADVPEPRNVVELHTFARRRLGKDVLDVEDATATVPTPDGDRVLLDDVTWRIGPGDRIGLVGVNGSGKSTLLRVLVGERPLESGVRKVGSTVRIGYLSQAVAELPADLRLIEAVSEIAGTVNLGGKDLTAGQLAERFGFTNAQQWTRVGELSGGERRRLQLLRILMAEPNVLVLDEPTNDLDTDTLSALEDLLDSWPGTLLVVSHDRYLVERVTDDVVALFGDGRITGLPGGIDEYLRRRREGAAATARPAAGRPGLPGPAAPAAPTALDPGEARQLRKDLQRLEKKMESLQRKESDLHRRLADVGADFAAAAAMDAELRSVLGEREDVELEWLGVAEKLEQG